MIPNLNEIHQKISGKMNSTVNWKRWEWEWYETQGGHLNNLEIIMQLIKMQTSAWFR